jgi:tetracycline 7-halogenase / FADH2 O2-dependent halogenase
MIERRVQIAIVGSGFGGSLMAMVTRRLGFSTLLLERGRHPRFVIGESTTPLTNLLLEELSRTYDLPALRPLCKWGTWQSERAAIPCGLKRGFTFYHHELDRPFEADPRGRRQLLVGASPRDEVADTHWYRPVFDQYLVEQAQALGTEYLDEVGLDQVEEPSTAMVLRGKRGNQSVRIIADFLIDASGPRGFLFRKLGLPERPLEGLPPTQSLFSHFNEVGPLPECFTLPGRTPPYPPENAAVHHVFPGGWIWVLKFNHGITSAGVAAMDPLAEQVKLKSGEPGWRNLLARLPILEQIFGPARNVVPFVYQPRLAFQCERVVGSRWALLPSAVGIVDPLLSTGFPLNLLGILRLGEALQAHWGQSSFTSALDGYARVTALELQTTAKLVGALYHTMGRFDLFKSLSLLYFAAASFSEVARRLGKPHLANSFLLCRNEKFAAPLRAICEDAGRVGSPKEAEELKQRILKFIDPFDLAGLTDTSRDPWYPARGEDIFRNAAKLGATREEIGRLLAH